MSRAKMDETRSVRIDLSVIKEVRKEAARRKTTIRVVIEEAWSSYKEVKGTQ